MTKAQFSNSTTITIITRDGEVFTLNTHLPVPVDNQKAICQSMAYYFEENFSEDKSSMVYWVLMRMMTYEGFSFSYGSSDRSAERERIGAKIKALRVEKGMDAKQLALLADVDAANLSRIEQGRYSIGLDILARISFALGVKVDLIKVK